MSAVFWRSLKLASYPGTIWGGGGYCTDECCFLEIIEVSLISRHHLGGGGGGYCTDECCFLEIIEVSLISRHHLGGGVITLMSAVFWRSLKLASYPGTIWGGGGGGGGLLH